MRYLTDHMKEELSKQICFSLIDRSKEEGRSIMLSEDMYRFIMASNYLGAVNSLVEYGQYEHAKKDFFIMLGEALYDVLTQENGQNLSVEELVLAVERSPQVATQITLLEQQEVQYCERDTRQHTVCKETIERRSFAKRFLDEKEQIQLNTTLDKN